MGYCVFLFKQKTAYEMRMSDWSSDVCSSDLLISDFIAKKVRQRVKDPKVAELLIPKDHGFGLKRVPMEDRYYEAFNQDNVTLVDLLQHPIERITPNGVKTTAQEHQLDEIGRASCRERVCQYV